MSEMLVYSHTTQYKSRIASINKIFAYLEKLEMQSVFFCYLFLLIKTLRTVAKISSNY